jgi:hypothetical protein
MPRHRTAPPLRRALPPLGALLTLGLAAGLLIGAQATPTADAAQPAAAAADRPASSSAVVKVVAPPRSPTYAFLLMQPDKVTPIRWNPCKAIHYKVATNKLVPAGEIPKVRAAFDTLGKALGGVRFVYDGATTVIPDTVDDSSRAKTDIVFAFATAGSGPRRSALLSGWEAGRGGFAAWGPSAPDGTVVERPSHGSVVIDASKWKVMNRHDRTLLYLHEAGHAVGLDHPQSSDQIMSSGAYDLPTRYQPGDLAGLALLGKKAGCSP